MMDFEYLIPEISLDAMRYPSQSPMSDCFSFSEVSGSDHGSYYADYSRSASPAFSETPSAEYASRGPSNATFASSLSPTRPSFSPFVSSGELPVLEEFEFPGYDGGVFLSVPPMGSRRYSFASPSSTMSNYSELLNTPADVMSAAPMPHPEMMTDYTIESSGHMYAPNPEDSWNKVDTLGLFDHNQGFLDGTSIIVGSGVSGKQAWDYIDKLEFNKEFVDGHVAATATRTPDVPSDHPSIYTMGI
ncbi:hypothetical protein BDQ12DRAFT_57782 [Crucibulum laeve]|uniref:Uncharacterized protein n=1 Tax=Crucibulum laeve TaxID=68775 RepID=A0A5C3M527_9AGAR|nr:hypothetical protein BDQ12DRAFT_57782 [Crucibulum laeve]